MLAREENGLIVEYPVLDYRSRFPNTSVAANYETNPKAPYVYVAPVEAPKAQWNQKVVESDPVKINGQWRQNWQMVDMTESEMEEAVARIQADFSDKVQRRLDDFARTRNYDGILSACSYATDTTSEKFRSEGEYSVYVRSLTWSKMYEIVEEVLSGSRPMPESFADIEADLPVLEWPE